MAINKANIANALHSVATEHIVTTADEVFDESRQQYQSEINEGVGRYIKNPEFLEVKLDDNGMILEATMLDGTKLLPAGYNIQGITTKVQSNPEYLYAILDNANHILFAIDVDGNIVFAKGVPDSIKKYIDKRLDENVLAIEFEDNGDIVAYFGEEGRIHDVYMEESGDIIVEQNITVD